MTEQGSAARRRARADKSRARRVWRAVVVLLSVLATGALLGVLWLLSSLPTVDGEIRLPGLGSEVRILRDANGIPHIRAATQNDAFFALGFVHAQDRLWQLDFERRVASGRLSEILGARTVDHDRFMRTLGLARLAEASLAHLSAEVRAALEAYSAGVNAHLATRRGALPLEFVILGYEPEPWRPAESLLWGRLMGMRLSGNWHGELLRALLAQRLDAERLAALWPPYPGDAPVTLPDLAEETGRAPLGPLWASLPADPTPGSASNAWVLGGRHTATGKPILANDPHLGFQAPNLWYLARIETPGLTLAGGTVPGVPFTILGHNGRIAWGFTTTNGDTQDLFLEKIDADDPGRYLTPEGSEPFRLREERIAVRGEPDLVLTVRESRHGPILSDVPGLADGATDEGVAIALQASALLVDDRTAQAMYELNRAQGWDDVRRALARFNAPQQNVVYADTEGNIGFLAPARVPIRRKGDGYVPVPGWSGEYDWQGFIPYDSLPRRLNPPSGRFVTANHKIVDSGYPYFLSRDWEEPYRAARVNDRLDEVPVHTLATTAAIQGDTVSVMAREILPLLLALAPPGGRSGEIAERLRAWDRDMDRDRPEPLVFTAWLRELNRLVYADELGALFPAYWGLRPRFIRSVLTERPEWCDDVGTEEKETCESRVRLALKTALDGLGGRYGEDWRTWRWGDAHRARFPHSLLSRIPLLAPLATIEIPTGGGHYTLNRAWTPVADEEAPFAAVHGAGMRAIYDLADLANSRFMTATGQSGNPFSRHYRDFTERWRDVEYVTMGGAGTGKRDDGVLVLRPE